MRKLQKKGFTLIEMVLVIVILSIVSVVAAKVMSAAFNSYFDNQSIVNANEQGRLALEKMVRDVHAINSPSSFITTNSNTLSFVDVNGNTVTYALSGTQLQRNGIALADGINTLAFSYYDGAGAIAATQAAIRYINVTVNITQNSVNYTLATTMTTLNYV